MYLNYFGHLFIRLLYDVRRGHSAYTQTSLLTRLLFSDVGNRMIEACNINGSYACRV